MISVVKVEKMLQQLLRWDLYVAQSIYQISGGNTYYGKIIWEIVAHTGDGILWFVMIPPILVLGLYTGYFSPLSKEQKYVLTYFYICNFVDIVSIIILKLICKRQRPPHHRTDSRFVGPDQHSFPSGHATRAATVLSMLKQIISESPAGILQRTFGIPSLNSVMVLILLICYSRLALGRHYFTDVLVGIFVGSYINFPLSQVLMETYYF